MKNIKFQFSSDTEVEKRAKLMQDFLEKIISIDEQPFFISDDATIFDICSDDEDSLMESIANSYGIRPSRQQMKLKLWKLVDLLNPGSRQKEDFNE